MQVAFIDLDNIGFVENSINKEVLEKRLAKILNMKADKYIYYCNKVTQKYLEKYEIDVTGKLVVVKTKKDEADHKIIYDVMKMCTKKNVNVHIISNDKIFMRLAMFMVPHKDNIHMYVFKKTKLVESTKDMNICFKKRGELSKFIESYNLLKQRYLL